MTQILAITSLHWGGFLLASDGQVLVQGVQDVVLVVPEREQFDFRANAATIKSQIEMVQSDYLLIDDTAGTLLQSDSRLLSTSGFIN